MFASYVSSTPTVVTGFVMVSAVERDGAVHHRRVQPTLFLFAPGWWTGTIPGMLSLGSVAKTGKLRVLLGIGR